MPQSFRCDSCAAPLEFEGNNSAFQRCDFCGNQVIVPAEVRTAFNSHFDFGGDMISQAKKLKEIKQVALGGNQILAIKMYREIFGCGLKEAKDAVDNIVAGRPVVFTSVQNFPSGFGDIDNAVGQAMKIAQVQAELAAGRKINAIKIFREATGCSLKEAKDAVEAMERGETINLSDFPRFDAKTRNISVEFQPGTAATIAKTAGLSFLASFILIFVAVGVIVAGIIYALTGFKTVTPALSSATTPTTTVSTSVSTTINGKPQFAREVFKFGGEGLGAGQFDGNRAIAIDGDGRIYSANYSEGRIQAFDAGGKFLTQWIVEGENVYISSLAADRAGRVFVPLTREVRVYEGAIGKEIGKITIPNEYTNDVAAALDGTLWVTTTSGNIHHLSSDGKQTLLTIKNAGKLAGLKQSNLEQVAVDGANNVYVADRNDYYILKFNSKGEFLARFGGKPDKFTKGTPPGKLSQSVYGLAVDNQGRIYASEISRVVVFDSEGSFLGEFETKQTFGLAFNDKNELWAATRPFVTKFEISEK